MKGLILALPLLIATAVGYWIGRAKSPTSKHYERLYKVSNQRSVDADALIRRLSMKAAEQSMLGETFAWTVSAEIEDYWKNQQKGSPQ